MKEHNKWISICKGIGICLVVLGHSQLEILSKYIFWFHMPFFFISAGYLFSNTYSLMDLIKKRSKRMLVPYFSFGVLTLIIVQTQSYNLNEIPLYIENILLGGRRLGYFYGIYWFPTTLFLTIIVFATLRRVIKNDVIVISLVIVSYTLSHLYVANNELKVYWSLDTVSISIFYFAVGYYGKQLINKTNTWYGVVALSISVMLIIADHYNMIQYKLDLKANAYNHLLLDVIIPIVFTILIISIGKLIEHTFTGSVFNEVGKMSMTVMYLHISVMIIVRSYLELNEVSVALIAFLVPVIVHLIFKQSPLLRAIFFGESFKRIKYESETRSA